MCHDSFGRSSPSVLKDFKGWVRVRLGAKRSTAQYKKRARICRICLRKPFMFLRTFGSVNRCFVTGISYGINCLFRLHDEMFHLQKLTIEKQNLYCRHHIHKYLVLPTFRTPRLCCLLKSGAILWSYV